MAKCRLLLVLLLSTICLASADINSAIKKFMHDEDIEAFCNALEDEYAMECRTGLDDADISTLLTKLASKDRELIVDYMKEFIFKQDPRFDLDIDECDDLHAAIQETDDEDILSLLESTLKDRGYSLTRSKIRAKRTLAKRAKAVKQSRSCNIKFLIEHFGVVNDRFWNYRPSVSSIKSHIPEIPTYNGFQTFTDYLFAFFPENKDKAERFIEERRKQQLEAEMADKKLKDRIAELEKLCYLKRNHKSCNSLDEIKREVILANLGSTAIEWLDADPRLKNTFYTLARTTGYFMSFSLNGIVDQASLNIIILHKYSLVLAMVIAVLLIGYRNDLSTLTSFFLSSIGFSIIPIISWASWFLKFIIERIPGVFVATTIIGITAGYHLEHISTSSMIALCYLLVVVYTTVLTSTADANVPGRQIYRTNPILVVLPLILYSLWMHCDISFDTIHSLKEQIKVTSFTASKNYTNVVVDFFRQDVPDLLPTLTLVVCLTKFIVCNYCDIIGWSAYCDVANNASKARPTDFVLPKPSINDYLGAAFNSNTIILLACMGVPGMLYSTTWVFLLCVLSCSVILAAIIYQACFHDEFIREGKNTGAAKERIVDTMNIIVGMAPKNVILPRFQNYAMTSIVLMSLLTFARVNVVSGSVASALVALLIFKTPEKLQVYIGWCCGLAIMFCGTLTHSIIGLLYLIYHIGNNITFRTSAMNIGEMFRSVDVSL